MADKNNKFQFAKPSSFKIRDINDMRDSKLMFDKEPPKLGYAVLTILTVAIVAVIIWSTQATRTYLCIGSGQVQSTNKTYVMSSYTGSISEIYIEEGTYVNEGDVLAHVKSTDIDLQQEQYEAQLAIYQDQLDQYNKLIRSIQDNVNYFSETDPNDQAYYYQYESYQSQVAQNQLDITAYADAGYSDAQIQTLIEQNQSQVAQIYYSYLQSASQQVTSLQASIDSIQSQIDALNTGANDYYLTAPTSGVVHMDTEYKQGMVLGAGYSLCSIASANDDLEIVTYVSLSDRPLLHVGDPCTIAVTGLVQSVYGTLTGKVTSIDSDITSSSSTSVYKLTIVPDSTYLVSKSGNQVSLSNGMSVETRIQYDEITYFEYVMEALGVLVR
jgi:multidrug resistance efflux pump